jgi:hypothetical protein
VGARFSAPVQNCPRTHTAYYTICTRPFLGVKQPERGVDYPPTSSAEVKDKKTFMACSRVTFTFPEVIRAGNELLYLLSSSSSDYLHKEVTEIWTSVQKLLFHSL